MSIYEANIPKSKKAIINEAYYSKTKDVLAIEKQIGVIRQKHINDNKYFGDFNLNPDVVKLNRLFEKAFGFYAFSMNIIPSTQRNANTIPVGRKIDSGILQDINKIKKITIVDKDGLHFTPNNGMVVICNIYSGLFLDPNFTDGEITAIILHELGHNFATALDKNISENDQLISMMQIILAIIDISMGKIDNALNAMMSSNSIGKFIADCYEMMSTGNKSMIMLYNILTGIQGFGRDVITNIVKVIGGLVLPVTLIYGLINQLIANMMNYTGYQNEKIADNFAQQYGYGLELSSALAKMEFTPNGKVEEFINDVPFLGPLCKLPEDIVYVVLGAFDVHPPTSERIHNQLLSCEYELKKANLDPKAKKELLREIDEINKLKTKILSQKGKPNDVYWLRRIWFEKFANGETARPTTPVDQQLDYEIDRLRVQNGSNSIMRRRYEVF